MSNMLTDAAEDAAESDDTGRRIMTARFIADEILRGAKRVSGKAARALADGFVARDRQAAASYQELQALRSHYDRAAPEHNLLALLDLYQARESESNAKLSACRSALAEACDLATKIDRGDGYTDQIAELRKAGEP